MKTATVLSLMLTAGCISQRYSPSPATSFALDSNDVICRAATTADGEAWEQTTFYRLHVQEARRRGLSLQKCSQLTGQGNQTASFSNQSSGRPFAPYSDAYICRAATNEKGGWETDQMFTAYIEEAKYRNLYLQSCAKLTGRKVQNKFWIARDTKDRNTQLAQEERERKLEIERQSKAEADRIRIAKLELAKQQKAEERRQRELVRKRKMADAHEREMVPIRKKNRHSVAVIIGNKNYDGRTPAVDYAHNDADAMRSFVINKLGYRDGNIIDLRDAGRNRIAAVFGNDKTHEGELFNIIRKGKSDVTVYYSGHGVPGLKDKRPYLLPVNGNPDLAEITGYSVDTLYTNLAKLPARSVTVYLDACFSGDSEKGMLVSSASGLGLEQEIPAASGRLTVITAAQGSQLASWDPKARHGLFTKYLLEALIGKADDKEYGNADGKVSLAEVRNFLADEMTYQARRTWNRRQNAYVSGNGKAVLSTVLPTQ